MKKILFMFNQLVDTTFGTGGDVLGKEILAYINKEHETTPLVSAPKYAKRCFAKNKVFTLGDNFFDKNIFKPNVVSTYVFAYIGRALEFIKKYKNIKPDVIYTTGDFFCNVAPAYYLKRKDKTIRWVTCIYHINNFPLTRHVAFIRGLVSFGMQQLSFAFIKKNADTIFVLSKIMRRKLHKLGFANNIVVSGAGLHTKDFQKKFKLLKQTKDIVFFNRVNPTKGVFDLPEILSYVTAKLPTTKLHIIGSISPSIKKRLSKKFAQKACLKNVVFHGFIKDKDEAHQLINSCKVFVQPSYEEGWGIGLQEGILCHCIPIAYKLPTYKELFGNVLYTAPLGNKKRFANLTLRILKLEGKTYQTRLTQLQKIVGRYDWSSVYEKQKFYLT